jgi:hypothetical protein
MGISIEAKTPKSAPPKSKEDAAKTMAATELELTEKKRTADKRRAFQRLMKQAGKKTDAGKARLAKGGSVKKYSSGGGVLRKAK